MTRTLQLSRDAWSEELAAFTQRNAGRYTVLEEHDAEFGPQWVEQNYPLRGIAWDHHDECIDIMLGDLTGTDRHITRSISNIQDVQLESDAEGPDLALRIGHGTGAATLLVITHDRVPRGRVG